MVRMVSVPCTRDLISLGRSTVLSTNPILTYSHAHDSCSSGILAKLCTIFRISIHESLRYCKVTTCQAYCGTCTYGTEQNACPFLRNSLPLTVRLCYSATVAGASHCHDTDRVIGVTYTERKRIGCWHCSDNPENLESCKQPSYYSLRSSQSPYVTQRPFKDVPTVST